MGMAHKNRGNKNKKTKECFIKKKFFDLKMLWSTGCNTQKLNVVFLSRKYIIYFFGRNFLRTYLDVHMFARMFYQRSQFSISFIYVQLYSFMFKNVHYCSFTFIFLQLRSYNLWTFMKIFFKNVRGCSM
jgi:hypothetical protein